jgi:hypothetical protein
VRVTGEEAREEAPGLRRSGAFTTRSRRSHGDLLLRLFVQSVVPSIVAMLHAAIVRAALRREPNVRPGLTVASVGPAMARLRRGDSMTMATSP